MSHNSKETLLENQHLEKTLGFIKSLLTSEYSEINDKEESLIAFRREMYENSSHHSQDFNKLIETVQYLDPLAMQTMDFEVSKQRIALYEKMSNNPYFARVDFQSQNWEKETIYIGIGNLENEDTFESYVYDWRAPISSVFYRFELGPASYTAPAGEITGEITLKRQFEIEKGKLRFFFDSSVNILDDILKDVLSKNTSSQMKTIVETIQREQDIIIRDVDSDLLIVQGVAGSGKTSIALHRAAYLMYEGLNGHLQSNNMILISPNNLFAQYIANVLPELGEDNINTVTFEKLFFTHYNEDIVFNKRNSMLEEILIAEPRQRALLQDTLSFKNSTVFLEILNRFILHYQRTMIEFTDVLYDGKTIAKKELLKARFLESSSKSLPVQVRLNHLESIITDRIKAARPYRIKKLEDHVSNNMDHSFDFKTQARLLNTKQVSRIMKHVRSFTKIDYIDLYSRLFSQRALFKKLSAGLLLPENIDDILALTQEKLKSNTLDYSDAMAILLLKLRTNSVIENINIRQVVVDEAQDYSAVHFEILARLFPGAKYTVLGDINQTIVGLGESNIYDTAKSILNKKKSTTVSLNKSFRCSYEISSFAAQFSEKSIEIEQLDRFEERPAIINQKDEDSLIEALLTQLAVWRSQGYKSIAVTCKSARQARSLHRKIAHRWEVSLFTNDETPAITDTIILPVYLAKGLEFDAVGIYQANEENYSTPDDRRLLYISSTRALHRLGLFYTGKLSPLITEPD